MKKILILMFLMNFNVYAKNITYKIGSETFEGYLLNKGKDAPVVLIIHDWDGLTDYEVKRAHMLEKLGYSVFAIDMYGKNIRPTKVAEKKKRTGALYKDRSRMRALMNGGLKAAEQSGLSLSNAVILGYCFGGTSVLELARSGRNLKSFISFHGGLDTPDGQDYSQVRGEVVIFHGSADKVVSLKSFAELGEKMEKARVRHEMITYSGAPHAFSVFGSERYRKDADEKSWQRLIQYLAQIK